MKKTDEELEAYIDAAWHSILESATEESKRLAASRLAQLIGKRSPERIEEMERQQGLR